MNILGNKAKRGNNIRIRFKWTRRATMAGYFILTMSIIWTAALASILTYGDITSLGDWLPALLLTLFFLVLALLIMKSAELFDD